MLGDMTDRVACGYDGSLESMAAVRLACAIARALECSLVVLHENEGSPYGLGPNGSELRGKIAEQWTKRLRRRIGAVGGKPLVRFEPGDPAMCLLSLAAEDSCQLMVLGSRGRGEGSALLLGSVSRRLAAEACAPVVIVPPEAAADPELEVLEGAPFVCGVDGSQEAKAAVAVAARLAAATNGNLVLANVAEGGYSGGVPMEDLDFEARLTDDAQARLNLLHRAYGSRSGQVPVRVELLSSPEAGSAEALEWLAGEQEAKLIAVGSRGRGTVRSALLGSTSAALARSASRPILIVPPAAVPRAVATATLDRPSTAGARATSEG